MGQYFAAVNTDKKEFVCPWCIGGGAKLWEWAANPQGAIFTMLLRKSSEGGGGDYESVCGTLPSVVGSWAQDDVMLVGDYDSSGLWEQIQERDRYKNISEEVVEAWNAFIDVEEKKLRYHPCGCHEKQERKGFVSSQPTP